MAKPPLYQRAFEPTGDNIVGVMSDYYSLNLPVSAWDDSIRVVGLRGAIVGDVEVPGSLPMVEIWINALGGCHSADRSLRIVTDGNQWGVIDYDAGTLVDLGALEIGSEYENVKLSMNDRDKIMPYVRKYLEWVSGTKEEVSGSSP